MDHVYRTRNVCSTDIYFTLEGKYVRNIRFVGGCNGNLKAIARIVDGWTVDEIVEKLGGNTCGRRYTSCADQLSIAVREAYEEENRRH